MKKERKRKKAKKSAEQPIVKVETGETLAEEICALQLFSEELGGKWRMRVLWALHDGSGCRYSLVKNRIPGITDMMLTQSLKELQHSGYVSREQFPESPPRVEYQITDLGKTLLPLLSSVIQWEKENRAARLLEYRQPAAAQP